MPEPKYKRIILKLSGEAMAGNNSVGIEMDYIKLIAEQVKKQVVR